MDENDKEKNIELDKEKNIELEKKKIFKKKANKNKICFHTFKASFKRSLFVSTISVISITFIFLFFIMPRRDRKLKKEIFNIINDEKENLRVLVTYDFITKSVSYGIILREIIAIEKGIVNAKKRRGGNLPNWCRLTIKEFEQTATILYIEQYYHHLDWKGYISNRCGESHWNKKSKSHKGAKGVDQLMPGTFSWVNKDILSKYGLYDMYNVYHNTQAGVAYWLKSRNYLEWKLKRKPTIKEIAMAYNMGYEGAARALITNNPNRYLSEETRNHGKKVQFYYENILKKNYNVHWTKK